MTHRLNFSKTCFWFLLILLILLSGRPTRVIQAQTSTKTTNSSSSENFVTSLNSTYTVDIKGQTYVEHLFKIKNLSPEFFITKYGIKVGSNQISNIQVTSSGQTLDPEIVPHDNQTSIGITFPDKVVGKDKVRTFTINYQNPDIAQVNGQVLEVNIPQMANPKEYDQHSLTLATPAKFKRPTRITPVGYKINQDSQVITQYQQLGGQAVSAIFGDEQIFNLDLRYHLENPSNQKAITQISLPPDTAYQTVNYQLLDPQPASLKTDLDGNWIATYKLPPTQTVVVNLKAQVLIGVDPLNPNLQPQPLALHTTAQPFWPITDAKIKELAQAYQTPQQIYQFTVDHLTYAYPKLESGETLEVERLGAVKVLEQPTTATCQEFTDLFITLARANQIPARRITGYAYSQNSVLRPLSLVTDILHTWPEYYDQTKQAWVPVDPTWGNTTQGVDYFNQFDLNHVVLAINGQDSQRPFPAGSYKVTGKDTKDVKVEFGHTFPQTQPNFELTVIPKKFGPLTIPGFYELQIINQTGRAWHNLKLTSQTNNQTQATFDQTVAIIPFQTKTINLTLYNKDSWLFSPVSLTLTSKIPDQPAYSQTYEFSLKAIGQSKQYLFNPQALLILGGTIIILTLAAGSLLVFRRR